MLKMAVGHSEDIDADVAAAEALAQCAETLGGIAPQAGLAFAGPGLDPEVLLHSVTTTYPDIELIGCTTDGEMSSVLGFGEDSFTLALFASDVLDFAAGYGTNASQGVRASCREAIEHARAKTEKEPALCITTPTVVSIDPDDVVAGLSSLLGLEVPVLGGGSAVEDERAAAWGGTFQFYGDRTLRDSIPVLVVSGPLIYSVGVAHGWKPVGRKGVVTRAHGNVVHEIDGETPLKFYEHYLGGSGGSALATPLAIFDEEDPSRFYLRAPTGFDEEAGTATFLGSVPEGAIVQISLASTDQILEGTDLALDEAVGQYPDGSGPEAAFVVSCAARKWLLGTRTGSEMERIRDRLGNDVPVCGFYAFGEIAPLSAKTDPQFHNETCVAVLLGT